MDLGRGHLRLAGLVLASVLSFAWLALQLKAGGQMGVGRRLLQEGEALGRPRPRTLSFRVCNGFANQRLALLNGLLLARELGRAAVLPQLVLNGRQDDPSTTNYGEAGGAPLSAFYDDAHLAAVVERLGVRLAAAPAGGSVARVPDRATATALGAEQSADHVVFGCPLLRLGPEVALRHEDFVVNFLAALRPAPPLADLVAAAVANLTARLGGGSGFNFLHLRLESDWVTHCSSWRFGQPDDNCFTNTLAIDRHLADKGLGTEVPLYVAFEEVAAPPQAAALALGRLRAAGYHVVQAGQVLPAGAGLGAAPREVAAAVEYYIALAAAKFIGNSVSTFSALAILEREQRGLWASYYNGGEVPLASFLPLYTMPWVFTYNGGSPGVDYMVKAAVASAQAARLTPFCIYNGTETDPMAVWLAGHGVRVVRHTPTWLPRLAAAFPAARRYTHVSPLYGSLESLAGTFQRIDIPVIEALRQFNYVLFTDADVVFERPLALADFPRPLPTSLAMAVEMTDAFPCNAGVMLMHLPFLRRSHAQLVDFVFSRPGLFYEGFGPGDQGALNQFYAASMGRACGLGEEFNAKPYKPPLPAPYVLHFHGPKPRDYLAWRAGAGCALGSMCAEGFEQACAAMDRHRPHLPACVAARAPAVNRI